MSDTTILILGNTAKRGVAEQIEALLPWFKARCGVNVIATDCLSLPPEARSAALAIVLGGDGTMLWAARLLAGHDIPMIGVNMGKLGFLAEYDVAHMQKHFDDLVAGRLAPSRRIMLEARVIGPGSEGFSSPAVNDVVVSAGQPFRMIELSLEQGSSYIAGYRGDGLVIATPTGSTAYNMSVGGSIMDPALEAIAITPIAPHSLTIRPIVVRPDETIRVTAVKVNAGSAVIIDGQVSSHLNPGQVIEVRKAPYCLKLIPHPGRAFYQTLSDKLQWGQNPTRIV